jgi:dihydrofolate reductase
MRKLVESTYVSLDGMIAGEAFWGAQMQFHGEEHAAHAARLLEPADALLLGRKTYEVFAESWPGREGDFADRINAMPKYVASRTLTDATWSSEVLEGDIVDAVARVKEDGDGTLLKYGTGPVTQALIEGGQLDELHLWVFPFIVGAGERLLPGITTTHLDLTEVTEVGNGVVVLTYTPAR